MQSLFIYLLFIKMICKFVIYYISWIGDVKTRWDNISQLFYDLLP